MPAKPLEPETKDVHELGAEDALAVEEQVDSTSAKLLRITVMAHELLDEARHMPLDDGARHRLRDIHTATVRELDGLLPPDLREEFDSFASPLSATASEAEVKLAQVQLVGWLEGLMHGIQAALWARVVHAISHVPKAATADADDISGTARGPYL